MTLATRVRTLALAILAALAFQPARAQMDPRLQTSKTDLLDVYKVNSAPPELLTVFDFSGSMHAVYWDPRYYTAAGQTGHNALWDNMTSGTGGDFPGIVPCFDANGYIWMIEGTGYFQNIYTLAQATQFQVDGSGKPTAQLIAPDGSVITIDHTKFYTQTKLDALVQQASHVRVTATATVNLGGTPQVVTRTVDLPIPWAVMDPSKTSSNNASATLVTFIDPVAPTNTPVPPDDLYASTSQDNIVNNVNAGRYKIGRFHYNKDYLWWVFFGTDTRNATNNGVDDTHKTFAVAAQNDSLGGAYEPSGYPAASWNNGLTGMTRFQALKYAVVKAWFDNEGTDLNIPPKVWWGYRFLDDSEDGTSYVSSDNGSASSTQVTRDIRLMSRATGGTWSPTLKHFIDMEPSTSTPLTHAFANAYAQMALTNEAQSTFGPGNGKGTNQSGTDVSPIPPCRKSFVVVFTDGIANDSGIKLGDPYAQGTEEKGNTALGSPSNMVPGNADFNIWTLAGAVAHYNPGGPYTGPTKGSFRLDKYMPYLVTSRGATAAAPRRVRTMTVGMSLAGSLGEAGSGKSELFRAALYGNPDTKSWNLSTAPFDPNDPSSDPTVNPFYFDATDVNKLSQALTAILAEVTGGSASVAAPASPLVGLSLGNQAYLGLFQTVKGPRWKGDLLMAGLYLGPSGVSFLDDKGNAIGTVTDQNAIWSANLSIFSAGVRTWKTRNIYTNLPGTTTLVPFDESTTALTQAMVGATDDPTRTAYIRFMRGAETAGETDATDITPRNDIMGDIVNSAPTVLEYPTSALTSSVSPYLAGKLGTVPSGSTAHFRVIFAGDNQGIFHAFGEVSWTTEGTITFYTTTIDPVTGDPVTTTNTTTGLIPHGYVDEIWAFIPGEYLKSIVQLRSRSNPHRYMMDGTPTVYFKDVPAAGQTRGNGLVDGSDVVRVIVGERKGGRSYYAFDFANLAAAVGNSGTTMAWKLVPDDVPSNTTDAQQNVIRHMGYSTTTPALARVDMSGGVVNQDMVFLGGGLSTSDVDAAFAADSTFKDSNAKLGRSILAFDVATGPTKNLYTWNFNDSTFTTKFGAMGCIPAGVVPLEFFQGSGHTQRVYFSDSPTAANVSSTSPRGGGVWVLGNTGLATNAVIRLDSSSIDDWTSSNKANTTQGIRHVFQTPTGWSITTTPTPFLLAGPYPVIRTSDPKTAPIAVGLSFGTGDRNDPMDADGINPAVTSGSTTTPYNNWVNVIFDRQDSASLSGVSGVSTSNLDIPGIQQGKTSSDGDIADLTTVSAFTGTFNGYSVDPANSAYYLKQKLGYKLNMGAATKSSSGYFFPKVITNTVVLNGVLFFSDFLPSQGTDACKGTGITNTYRICNVLQPTFNSGSTSASSTSFNGGDPTCTGIVLTYPNLPGEITALGTAAVIQSGQGSNNGQTGTISNAGAQVGGSFGKTSGFGFRPRSWRIIR
ncbi:MAG TPA: hypothetical protein VFT46_07935 [Holophagaceae bacterium]|nr:hypothetical protein [Holophagaceae bacterium]